MNLASWNVRGLNKASHQREVTNFITSNSISFMGLLETKVKWDKSQKISQKINNKWSWEFNYDHHSNGRIWVGWDPSIWKVGLLSSSDQQMTCNVEFLEKHLAFIVTFVYAQNKPHHRLPLWDALSSLSSVITLPWCVTGDFNCVLSLDEVLGGREHWTPAMESFKDCLHTSGLGHIKSIGEAFSWSNNRPLQPIYKRLDRMLANKEWFSAFTESVAMVKNRGIMDHCPLLLTVPMSLQRFKKPFQFFNFLKDRPDFLSVVQTAWISEPSHGDHMLSLQRKLKKVKLALIDLNRKSGNVHTNVQLARTAVENAQRDLADNRLNLDLITAEKGAVLHLEQVLNLEEQLLLQKSRTKWLSLGDANNSFFFNQVKANWHHNKILVINDNLGQQVSGQSEVSLVAERFFKETLGTSNPYFPYDLMQQNIDAMHCNYIPTHKLAALTDFISPDLIFKTLSSLKKGKSPGPDGFTVEFFLHCWPIVQYDFCNAVQGFFLTNKMHASTNSTSIALIPKTAIPNSMVDFRPISLLNIPYKCISKILANRIKTVLPDIIDHSQSAFIKGRSISDNILLAQELFRGYGRETGSPKCSLKLDLHKAFDSVDWRFIISLLIKYKFPIIFVNWIRSCITTSMFSVKVNGVLSGYFRGAKGLRQGDPLSPYLFTIAMNTLSILLADKPAGFKHHWRCKDLGITHLLFADDVLLFAHGDIPSIRHIMDSVDLFSRISGLSASFDKSSVFFSNCKSEVVSWFQTHHNMPIGSLPVKFLGVPLISSKLSINDCIPLIEKMTKRLYSWTTILLSFAGRVQLIKAVLLAIQSFWTNHFMLPAAVHKNIQRLLTRFLWKGDINAIGGVKVSWEHVCLPKEEGGLGIKNPKDWNKAQILMHLCKIVSRSPNLWPSWINGTVLKRAKFWLMEIPTDCSWIWRRVLGLRQLALRFLKYNIGNGLNTSLWFDPWFHNVSLACSPNDHVLSLTALPSSATVNCLIDSGAWRLPTVALRRRHISARFSFWIANFDFPVFNLAKSDFITWDSVLLSKLTTHVVWSSIRLTGQPVVWDSAIWHRLHVPRFSHLSWLVCLGRISTKARLASFGLAIDTACLFCVGGIESSNHLFLHCAYSRFILRQLISKTRIVIDTWEGLTVWNDLLLCIAAVASPSQRLLGFLSLNVFCYHMWRERNHREHDKAGFHPNKLLDGILIDINVRIRTSNWFIKACSKNLLLASWLL